MDDKLSHPSNFENYCFYIELINIHHFENHFNHIHFKKQHHFQNINDSQITRYKYEKLPQILTQIKQQTFNYKPGDILIFDKFIIGFIDNNSHEILINILYKIFINIIINSSSRLTFFINQINENNMKNILTQFSKEYRNYCKTVFIF